MCSPVVSLFFHLTLGITHYFHKLLWLSCFCLFSLVTQNKSILLQWVKHSLSVSKQLSLLFTFSNLFLNTSVHPLSCFKKMYIRDTFIELAMVAVNVLLVRKFASSKPHGILGEFISFQYPILYIYQKWISSATGLPNSPVWLEPSGASPKPH